MGAKEKKGDVVLMSLDERVVVLLERIATQLDNVSNLLRHHVDASSSNIGADSIQPTILSQAKSDNNETFPEIRTGRDEIPMFDGEIVSGFGEEVP